jgi:hypothetical protein
MLNKNRYKIVLDFDNKDDARSFVVNLLEGGGEDYVCVDVDEKLNEFIYFDWLPEESKKDDDIWNYIRYTSKNARRESI